MGLRVKKRPQAVWPYRKLCSMFRCQEGLLVSVATVEVSSMRPAHNCFWGRLQPVFWNFGGGTSPPSPPKNIHKCQWLIQDFPYRGVRGRCANLLFGKMFAKICKKLKEIGSRGRIPSGLPPPNAWTFFNDETFVQTPLTSIWLCTFPVIAYWLYKHSPIYSSSLSLTWVFYNTDSLLPPHQIHLRGNLEFLIRMSGNRSQRGQLLVQHSCTPPCFST